MHVTLDDAVVMLRKTVEPTPDKVNFDCKYVGTDGKPMCLIGHVLINECGVPVKAFTGQGGTAKRRLGNGQLFRSIVEELDEWVTFDDDAAALLDHVQHELDLHRMDGLTWGDVLAEQVPA